MSERHVIRSVIDFSFIMKSQLYSDETALLRSIISIAIMEAEDLLEIFEKNECFDKKKTSHSASQ